MSASSTSHPAQNQDIKGEKAEGRRVRVFWEDDNKWLEGVVTRYSKGKDLYLVKYDKGQAYEMLKDMEFIKDKETNSNNNDNKKGANTNLRRSTRVVRRPKNSDDEDSEEEEEEDDAEEEPSSRAKRSTRATGKKSNGKKEVDSDSSETKPKRKIVKQKAESEDEEEEDGGEEFISDEEEPKTKVNTPKKTKKSDDSESDYEDSKPKSARKKQEEEEEEEDDDDDDNVIELNLHSDSDEEEEEEDEEEDGESEEDEEGEDSEDESEEEEEDDEDFKKEKGRKRGRQPQEKSKAQKKQKTKTTKGRGRPATSRVSSSVASDEGVQTIIAARRLQSPSTTTTTTTTHKSSGDSESTVSEDETTTTTTTSNVEFLVKFKGKSYRDVEWVHGDKLLEDYPTSKIRVRRIISNLPLPNDKPNPDFSIIDRVIDKRVQKGKQKNTTYLIKWRGLPYEECTWEEEGSLSSKQDKEKINQYNELEATAMKRSTKPRKLVKFSKSMDPPLFQGGRELKDFQKEGFLWLAFCWHQKRSSLLADEMGLGKTIQTISLLEYLRSVQGIPGPFLVIAPLSTIENWQREITDWTGMRALVLHGGKPSRDVIRQHEWKWPNGTYKFDALVTSYEIAILESSLIASTPWKVLVVDEAHRIKNQNSKLLSKLVTIKRDHSVMLTGTPLQNDMKELWSLLNFLEPDAFGSKDEFMEQYGDLKDSEQVQKLHEQLGPYILRRHKEDVDTTIPVKEETVLEVELSTVQKTYYRAIMEKNREFLGRGMSTKSNVPKLNNIMMQIRKVCNHPFLIPGVEDRMAMEKKLEPGALELLVQSCSKLVLVDKLLTKLREGGHKVLMFSQMVELLDILEEYLMAKNYPYERLDGGVKSQDRQAGIDRFNSRDQDSFVYLLSTRAGGVGINLTAADTVIIYDSDWNPQNDLQAQARCHRIGQTENVKVYRLLSRNTYEQYMFQVSAKKLALGHVVLLGKNGEYDGESDELDKRHVDKLLKYGAYDLFKEDLTEAASKEKHMQDEDIESILKRATTITYDSTQPKDSLGNGFNKATFVMSDNNDVDVDDADFWSKVLPEYKSLDYFRDRMNSMNSGATVATDESKAQFIEELSVYVQDRKDNPPSGVLLPGDLLNLLLQIEFNGRFNAEQRGTAKSLRESLEGTRGRRAAAQVSRTLTKRHAKMAGASSAKDDEDEAFEEQTDENEDVSGSEDDDERPNKRRKVAPGAPNAPTPSWNKARRERLKFALLRFGFGRWEKTAQEARVSPEEAQVYTENCVCKLLKSQSVPSPALLNHMATLSEQYEQYLQQTSKTARALLPKTPTQEYDTNITIDVVLVADGAQDPAHLFIPGDRFQFKLVPSGGTIDFENSPDLRLVGLYGTEIVRCYPIKSDVLNILAPGFIGSYEWKCIRPGPKHVVDCGGKSVTTQIGCHPMFFDENFDSAPRTPWVKKLAVLHHLHQLAEENGPTFSNLTFPFVPSPPLPEWTKDHDRLLLEGVYNYGYGKFSEILTDTELGLGAAIEKWVEESNGDLKTPTIPHLNKRLYRILEATKKQKHKQGLELEMKRRPEAPRRNHPEHEHTDGGEDEDKDFQYLTARIRFQNKELIIRMRNDDVFLSLSKPVLKQLNALGYCRGEGKLVFSYNGFQITAPQSTTPRKLNITDNFHLNLTWTTDRFEVEVLWLDKTISRVQLRKDQNMSEILAVKYAPPFTQLRLAHEGASFKLETTIEESGVKEGSRLTVIRLSDKMRISVTSPEHTTQHFKIMRTEPLSYFMEQYAKQINTNLDQLSFILHNHRIDPNLSPVELGLTEKDTIQVTVDTLLIVVRNEADASTDKYTIGSRTNLKYLMTKYTSRQSDKGNHNKISFTFQGREVIDGDTAHMLGIQNHGIIVASWGGDQTVIVTLKDYTTGASEEYRVGVDVVLRDLVDAFCGDNQLPVISHASMRVTIRGSPVALLETMKSLNVIDRDVVHLVRDMHPPPPPPSHHTLPPILSSPPSSKHHPLKPVYTIDE